jgi:hypothetical protein
MKRKPVRAVLLAATVIAMAAAHVAGQATPDLSGTWNLDAAKSDPAPAGPAGGRGRGNQNQMVITQTPAEITIVLGGATYIYNVDGSERTGPPGGETKSRMAWEGGRLVVTWKREYFAGPDKGYVTSSGKDTYRLDGGALTVERTTDSPAQSRKTVYNKLP